MSRFQLSGYLVKRLVTDAPLAQPMPDGKGPAA
jgi:hypothetical protein